MAGGLKARRRQGRGSCLFGVVSSRASGAHPCLSPPVLDCSPILSSFQVILLEHIIMCRLVTGHKATALQEVGPGAAGTQQGKAG